jgi:hypothetical protein
MAEKANGSHGQGFWDGVKEGWRQAPWRLPFVVGFVSGVAGASIVLWGG